MLTMWQMFKIKTKKLFATLKKTTFNFLKKNTFTKTNVFFFNEIKTRWRKSHLKKLKFCKNWSCSLVIFFIIIFCKTIKLKTKFWISTAALKRSWSTTRLIFSFSSNNFVPIYSHFSGWKLV